MFGLSPWRRIHDPKRGDLANPRISVAEQPVTEHAMVPCLTIPRGHRDAAAREVSSTIPEVRRVLPRCSYRPSSIELRFLYCVLLGGSAACTLGTGARKIVFNRFSSSSPLVHSRIVPILRDRSHRIPGGACPGARLRHNLLPLAWLVQRPRR